MNLTIGSQNTFIKYYRQKSNWSGTPMIESTDKREKGWITDLKKNELITTFESNGANFIQFTEKGENLAKVLGESI